MTSAVQLARVLATLQCRAARLWLHCLRFVFGFHSWHANAPYACRPYKRKVVELVDSLRPVTVVEVGCGLGDILSHVSAAKRFGIDPDPNVIRAARFLHPRGARWIHGDAFSIEEAVPGNEEIDCIVMVNWIHSLSPEQLAALLSPLLPKIKYLILDAIDPAGPKSYRFKHDFGFLSGRAERVSVTRAPDEPRSFILFKVIR